MNGGGGTHHLACPSCGQVNRVEKVSAAYAAGSTAASEQAVG